MKKLVMGLLALIATSSSAFAIDQVVLTNGEIVEGKVLSDVPNRHVDIQLINGTKKRFQRNEVASVERDVPSNKDYDTYGSDRRVYFGVMGGLVVDSDSSSNNTAFGYGARFGVNAGQMGDFAKFAVGLSYTRFQVSETVLNTPITAKFNEIMAQFLFRKVANSGFFFGPELGLIIISLSNDNTGASDSSTKFQMGINAGYDYYFSPSFSMGPSIYYDHVFGDASGNTFKFLLGATFHFE